MNAGEVMTHPANSPNTLTKPYDFILGYRVVN